MTAKCLACKEGVTPAEYCEKNPDTDGCKNACDKKALTKACIDEESLPTDSWKDKKKKKKKCEAKAKELCKK